MSDDQSVLGVDDYRALHALQMSNDPAQRAQASGLAKKLAPDEQQAFFDYQKTANAGKGELTREDNSVGGLPPEAIALSGIPIMRALGAEGVTAVSKVLSTLKATGTAVTPVLKYEAVRRSLQSMGVSPTLANAAGAAVAALTGGGGEAPAAETSATHLDRSIVVRPSSLTSDQLAQRIQSGTGTPPPNIPKPPVGITAQPTAATIAAPAQPLADVATTTSLREKAAKELMDRFSLPSSATARNTAQAGVRKFMNVDTVDKIAQQNGKTYGEAKQFFENQGYTIVR